MRNSGLGFYGSHDSSICFKVSDTEFRVYEFERLTGEKNCKINTHEKFEYWCKRVAKIIKEGYGITGFDQLYYGQLSAENISIIKKVFGIYLIKEVDHHLAHAHCAFDQSPFKKSLVFSYDSGGHCDNGITFFNIYIADVNATPKIKRIDTLPHNITSPYTDIAKPIIDIKKKGGYLTLAGKIMGLAAYGEVIDTWVPIISKFYNGHDYSTEPLLKKLRLPKEVTDKSAYNLAATSQYVFEKIAIETMVSFVDEYELPICLTGGGALNVVLNQKILETFRRKVFVPPNPGDSGLSFGFIAAMEPLTGKTDLMYSGVPLLGGETGNKVTEKEVAALIANNKIVGIARGDSECGARALGNRSILCNPGSKDMKDRLNNGVKFRESFRPFAPAVRLEDANKYFHFTDSSPYMSFSPRVRKEWIDKIPSVVHVDGTARLQTVTRKSNPYLYDIITEIEKLTGIGVVLNTSFNTRGKPILTHVNDAMDVLKTTGLDYVVTHDSLIKIP